MTINTEYLRIAVITGTHSLKGRLRIYAITDNPERFTRGNRVYLQKNESYLEYIVTEYIPQKKRHGLLKLEGLNSRTEAESLKGIEIFIQKSDALEERHQLDSESYYYFELIGCDVYLDGKKFSMVTDIIEAGSGDILIIENESSKKFMIPLVESIVNTDKISEKRIDIYPVEGLLD